MNPDFFDGQTFTRRELIALATVARESCDKAAKQAQDCAKSGDNEGMTFHTGRQCAFLTMYNAIMTAAK